MQRILTILSALWLAPLALAVQDDEPRDLKKPEVDLAAKGAKRAWESAPAASKALWLEHREALTHVDLSADERRQVIVARGTTEPDAYHAHPATAMLADGKTIFCVWNIGHGGHAGPIARSDDAGLTWHRIDGVMPPNYVNFKGGIIFRITDAHGKDRLWVFSGKTAVGRDEVINDFPGRLQGYVPRMVSEDDGKTWREEPPLGPGRLAKDEPFRCVFAFSTILPLKDGSHLGMFHRGAANGGAATLQVMQSVTRDGGFTWSEPVVACDGMKLAGKDPCEPYVFRSPDGGELCCLMRENKRSGTSLVMFSRDEGQTWSEAVDAPWGLTGDRHHGIRLPDGRLVIVFRHAAPNAKDRGLIAWVGTYDDIKQGRPGQYRVSLIKTFKDGLYPGLHLLPDGTLVATTYASLAPQENPSIVSIRFTIAEIDALAAKRGPPRAAAIDVEPVWAGHPVGFCLLTHPPLQFVAYYDAEQRMTVASRLLESRQWTFTRLPSTVGWDSHNYLNMVVDRGGFLHLAGNMHCNPLTSGQGRMNDYCTVPTLGPDGRFHMVWVWRDSTECETTHDLSYARSDDLVRRTDSRGVWYLSSMQTPLEFLNVFRHELRATSIPFAITSGMACVRYGLQQTTKDSDWIVAAEELPKLRGLLERCERRVPPWVVQYRPVFGAPFDAAWLEGGWSSHIFIRTMGGGPDHHLDFFCRPPRTAAWHHDLEDPDFADRDTVTRMKKTDRDKDWPIVGGLAAQALARGDTSAVLHLRDASTLRGAWSKTPAAERAQAITARPLLGSIDAGCEDLRLEFLLRAERLVWEAVNRHRYAIYQDAWKAWYRRWQKAADWPWPVSEPFVAQHQRIVAAAHDHELPMTPLTDGIRRDVYARGLADAAILANVEPDRLQAIAPPIEEVLP